MEHTSRLTILQTVPLVLRLIFYLPGSNRIQFISVTPQKSTFRSRFELNIQDVSQLPNPRVFKKGRKNHIHINLFTSSIIAHVCSTFRKHQDSSSCEYPGFLFLSYFVESVVREKCGAGEKVSVSKIIRNHLLWSVNINNKFDCNLGGCWQDICLWKYVMDRLTNQFK